MVLTWPGFGWADLNKPTGPEGERWITADHSKFEALQQEFKTGPEVTKACLSCHNEAGRQFMKTIHWTWLSPQAPKEAKLGKAGLVVNNFCIAVPSSEPRCTSCHAGYGYKNKNFDFGDQTRIDCLICHEQTGAYKKFPAGAGNPVEKPTVFPGDGKEYLPPDWKKVAQSVGRPTRRNCGVCHFFGGGGDGVKHGDLDSSMFKPERDLDVHMGVNGRNFDCVRCHTTVVHKISGRAYKTPAAEKRISLIQDDQISRITCESCHTDRPHKPGVKANDHTDKVSCQACHIPFFARKLPTKMRWDWSTAGRMVEGKPLKKMGPHDRPVYDGQKGDFIWAKDVTPEYLWFNGAIENVMAYTRINPDRPVVLTKVLGSRDDPNSRIYPFKVHAGKSPYDKKNNKMVIPKLFGPKGSGAYWADYDWGQAIKAGMDYVSLPYSGEYGFAETVYMFQITHQVAPKEKALACEACHSREGRLAKLEGFYMPGRDSNSTLNLIGWLAVIGSLAGVLLHGAGRVVAARKNNKNAEPEE
ncbi:MAG: tetrathionate reductase family octaheme c-type cytochrome [Thermodesulfobacteriota bacterium]